MAARIRAALRSGVAAVTALAGLAAWAGAGVSAEDRLRVERVAAEAVRLHQLTAVAGAGGSDARGGAGVDAWIQAVFTGSARREQLRLRGEARRTLADLAATERALGAGVEGPAWRVVRIRGARARLEGTATIWTLAEAVAPGTGEPVLLRPVNRVAVHLVLVRGRGDRWQVTGYRWHFLAGSGP